MDDKVYIFDTTLRDSIYMDTLCKGQSVVYEGVSYTTTGKYVIKWQSDGNSCWNKSILDLTFNDTFNIDIYDTMCTGTSKLYRYLTTLSTEGILSNNSRERTNLDGIAIYLTLASKRRLLSFNGGKG